MRIQGQLERKKQRLHSKLFNPESTAQCEGKYSSLYLFDLSVQVVQDQERFFITVDLFSHVSPPLLKFYLTYAVCLISAYTEQLIVSVLRCTNPLEKGSISVGSKGQKSVKPNLPDQNKEEHQIHSVSLPQMLFRTVTGSRQSMAQNDNVNENSISVVSLRNSKYATYLSSFEQLFKIGPFYYAILLKWAMRIRELWLAIKLCHKGVFRSHTTILNVPHPI